ncbi:unnamed protein product [Diamesa hyperborea]
MEVSHSDQMLLQLLTDKENLFAFLDSIFGFLARFTDFYVVDGPDNMGFPSHGMNEKVVLDILRKWDINDVENTNFTDYPPPAIYEEEVGKSDINTSTNEEQSVEEIQLNVSVPDDISEEVTQFPKIEKDIAGKVETLINETLVVNNTGKSFTSSDYFNGNCLGNYCWSQTLNEIEIQILLPETIKSSKNLDVKFQSQYISIKDKTTNDVLLDGKIFNRWKHNEAVWNVCNRKLQISMDKCIKSWWQQLLVTEPAIDVQKIDVTQDFDEFPESLQMGLEKLQKENEMTISGRKEENLSNGARQNPLTTEWKAEGSPFDANNVEFL